MKIQESAENYLETILILNRRNGHVRAIDIAVALEFSKPSVSIAMKHLRENGYIEVDGRGHITLTPAGAEIAERIYERHAFLSDWLGHITLTPAGAEIAERIYERHAFLSDWLAAIGVDPEVAAEDACRIEHVISAETFSALRRYAEKHGQ